MTTEELKSVLKTIVINFKESFKFYQTLKEKPLENQFRGTNLARTSQDQIVDALKELGFFVELPDPNGLRTIKFRWNEGEVKLDPDVVVIRLINYFESNNLLSKLRFYVSKKEDIEPKAKMAKCTLKVYSVGKLVYFLHNSEPRKGVIYESKITKFDDKFGPSEVEYGVIPIVNDKLQVDQEGQPYVVYSTRVYGDYKLLLQALEFRLKALG